MNRVVAVGGAATAAGLGAAVLWWGGQSALDRLRAQARAAARRHADRLFPPSLFNVIWIVPPACRPICAS